MEQYHWSSTYIAAVKFSSVKGCFMLVPEKWLNRLSSEAEVFKVLYDENREAFVSCLKGGRTAYVNEESEVLLNAKFAQKLGLKEGENVCLQPVTTNVPRVQKVTLEPLTSDDWEMLELNAQYVERELMNQIRVVWTNQVFPVWASQSIFYVKVAETQPNLCPLLLADFTEVHIVPKDRYESEALEKSSEVQKQKEKEKYFQYAHLRQKSNRHIPVECFKADNQDQESINDYENKGTTIRALSFLSYLFPKSSETKLSVDNSQSNHTDFLPLNFDSILRVIPYSNPQRKVLPLVVQATTVFISADTYATMYGATEIPPCFVAVLKKIPLPGEKKQQRQHGTNHQKSGKELKDRHNLRDKTSLLSEGENENMEHHLFDSVCVTVMVVHSPEEDEFDIPLILFYSRNLIVVPKELKRSLNLEVSCLVHIRSVQTKPVALNTVLLHPVSHVAQVTEEMLTESFKKYAFDNNREDSIFLLSDGTLLHLETYGQKCDYYITLEDNLNHTNHSSPSLHAVSSGSSGRNDDLQKGPRYGYLYSQILKKISVSIGCAMCSTISVDRPYLRKPSGLYQEIPALCLDALGGIKKLAAKAMEDIEFWLKLRPLSYISNHPFTFCGCMLICGPKGVGKSAFVNGICKKIVKHPYYVFVKIVHCLPLKGKRVETIAKKWDEILSEGVHCQPSLLLFEDLDYIASSPVSHEQESGPEGVYFSSVAQAFINMVNKMMRYEAKVAVIITSQSTHSLHPTLVTTKGRHIFQSILEIHPPNAEQREEILHSLVYSKSHISSSTIKQIPWSKLAARTEGYVAQDLDCLVDRATHAALLRFSLMPEYPEIGLIWDDFETALKGYIPSSLRGVPLQVQDQKTWNDVGGLIEVKKTIQQIIMWPSKYKEIFKNYSLKPQTNILLYGAPGTGKTLLAGIVANECGLNFISIKGPELLSKYIGASEQAIRDLFKRASAARPCILFFDEFDSIAPRRGHDSTGVTDRVVNQLLTQLDGVESLEGVHVLAATSRPELIDPALLRPGRLDKCLHCPLPDENERLEILNCLSSKLPLSEDIDFKFIAEHTEFFSGADLQALLYTAHIEALHDVQDSSTRRYSTSSDDTSYSAASDKLLYMATIQDGLTVPSYEDGKKIVQEVDVIKEKFLGMKEQTPRQRSTLEITICQQHVLRVVNEMKPSVSPEERLRYELVFKNFQSGLSGESVSSVSKGVKRVTLA